MSLNTKQKEAYTEIIEGTAPVVAVLGSAGVGKSYTISKAIKDFKGTITVTASTNKAAEVLADMLGMVTSTTHRALGFQLVRDGYAQKLTKVNQREVGDLLVIDELSMLPIELYEEAIKHNTKVVLVGDPYQLPSVSKGIDLDKLDIKVIELTEQMRQDKSNIELSDYFLNLRKSIDTNKVDFDLIQNIKGLNFIESHNEFCDIYNDTNVSKKILAYTNRVVDKYNYAVHSGEYFSIGDIVIINKPLFDPEGKIIANNGDKVKVLDVHIDKDIIFLQVQSLSGNKAFIRHYINNSIYEKELDYLKSKHDEYSYWQLRNETFKLKHSYASTIHKAQGDTYSTVFLDAKDLISAYNTNNPYKKSISFNMFLRLYYVAISRMKKESFIFIGDKRNYERIKNV